MSEDRILQALQALAEQDRERRAAPETEALLMREFKRRQGKRAWKWLVAGAVAAGILVAAFAITTRGPQPVDAPVPAASVAAAPAPAPPAATAVTLTVTGKPAPKPATAQRSSPHELVTEFFPLMDPALPFDRGQMLRVQLPAAAMRTVGLPVREEQLADPIEADVLVGEEGLARAIRFVRFDTQ